MLRLASVNMDDPERQSTCFSVIKGVIMHKVVRAHCHATQWLQYQAV